MASRRSHASAPKQTATTIRWETLATLHSYDGRVVRAGDVPHFLCALRSEALDEAREGLLELRGISLPEAQLGKRARRFATMQPPLCTTLIDGIADVPAELRGPTLVLVGDMLASRHALLLDAPDVHAQLRTLHRDKHGREVAAAVASRRDALCDLAAHADPEVRAAALFVVAMLPKKVATSIVTARIAAEPDAAVRHLACFVAGMHHLATDEPVFGWLGSTLTRAPLATPLDISALATPLPKERFPVLDGDLAGIASRRAIAHGGRRRGDIADRLLDLLATNPAIAEAAVAAAVTPRATGIPPAAMTPREHRAVALTAAHGARTHAFEAAGIPSDPARRNAWLSPSHPIDKPVPPGLVGSSPGEPLGTCLQRMQRAHRLQEAYASLATLISPVDHARVVAAAVARAYDIVGNESDLLPALEAAGADGVVVAREVLGDARPVLGIGSGIVGNIALLAIARIMGTVPPELVAHLSFASKFGRDVVHLLTPAERARIAVAVASTTDILEIPTTPNSFWVRKLPHLVELLALARSPEALRTLRERANASEHGAGYLRELVAIARAKSIDVPGLSVIGVEDGDR